MSKGLITVIIIGLLVLFGGVWSCNKRNSFVAKREAVQAQWQQVENQYQRRSDLIPNIVNTVKGQANFEKGTLEAVISARAKATQVQINPDKLDENSLAQFQKVQGELSGALSRLLVVSEQYPELRANEAFGDLRVSLEGTENRIAEERRKFNEVAREYNQSIQFFPGSLLAGGFTPAVYFKADEAAKTAPKVDFN